MEDLKKKRINELAKIFYKMRGYQVEEGYDFSNASHPEEKTMWNTAIVAFAFIQNDMSLLDYQV